MPRFGACGDPSSLLSVLLITQFDPELVAAFKNVVRDFEKIKRTFHDELEGIHDLDFTQRTAFKAGKKA